MVCPAGTNISWTSSFRLVRSFFKYPGVEHQACQEKYLKISDGLCPSLLWYMTGNSQCHSEEFRPVHPINSLVHVAKVLKKV